MSLVSSSHLRSRKLAWSTQALREMRALAVEFPQHQAAVLGKHGFKPLPDAERRQPKILELFAGSCRLSASLARSGASVESFEICRSLQEDLLRKAGDN